MSNDSRNEAAGIKKLPSELLEYLPARRWRGTLAAIIAVVLMLLMFLGFMLNIKLKYARMEADLDRHEALWESKGIDSYVFWIEGWADEGRARILVIVENGVVTSREPRPTSSGTESDPSLTYDNFDTVPELFAEARQTIRKAEKISTSVREASIAYNPDYGYPTYIGFGLASFLGSAGQYTYQVSNFRIIDQENPAR